MGVKNGSATLHSITDLTLAEVAHICRRMADSKGISPRIVADCSNLIYIFKGSYTPVVISLVNHFNKFTTAGMIVVPVCDGHVRPTAKQATNVRIASREKTRITALQLRSRIREIKDKLSNVEGSESVSLRSELEKELATAEKRVKQNETKSKDIVPPNFDIALANELRTRNAHNIDGESAGGYIDYVAVAEFQADSYMLGQLINNDAIMAMTKDTDIPILAGDCGMVINEFTKNKYQIVGTSESTLKFAMSLLPPKSGAKFKPALKPIFDGVQCPRLRSLMMVILGCDVYGSGMVGVSAAKLSTMIDTKKLEFAETFTEELLYSSLRQELMDKNQLSSEVVDTYINAIMYEPTNKTKTTSVDDEATNVEDEMTTASHLERSYLFGAPSSLPKYLEQFSIDDEFLRNNIIDGPGISLCKGVGDRSHQFLTDEGSRSCAHCGELTCVHCCEKADGDGKVDCLPCYATNALIPLAGCDGSKTIAEMRRELKDQFVIHHSESLTIDDCDALISDLQTQTPKNMEDKLRIAEEITTVMAAKAERLASELAQSNAVIQQMAEKDIDDNIPINPNLLHSMGVHVSRGNADEMRVEGKPFFHVKPIEGRAASTIQRRKAITTDDPIVDLSISDKEVMRRTGFSSLSALLAYVFIVSNSDIDRILQRKSSLTWFEEWFLHFEYNYGRTLTRYDDVEAVFGVRRPDAVDVVNHKYDIEYCALESWPPYAFHEEDMALRCKDKWAQYNNSRPIMWDMTNVSAYQFTDSDLQRLTFSEYYGECCFKGGVFTQLMGWQGVADLWTGRITDTDYTKREGYLTRQREFQERDKVKVDGEEIVLPFINIYDKGFRVNTAAWSEGQQLVLQPDFAKSDRRFSRHQTMSSASVASDRGANERTVNVSKRAGYIKRGLRPHMCPINYHKAWKTSAFKANFMYKPVL